MPSLLIEGTPVPILHRSQLAALLDLPRAAEPELATLVWDCASLQQAWIDGIAQLSIGALLTPTRSRCRTLRNLTVNVFHPFELVPDAFGHGDFPWDPDGDPEREAPLIEARDIVAYAEARRDQWLLFATADDGDILGDPPAWISTPRGAIAPGDLVAQQRWHIAFHYRQLCAHRAEKGAPIAQPFPLARLDRLDLPKDVF